MELMKVCKRCGGEYPCWCPHHDYVEVLDWILEFVRRCKG